MYENRVLQKEGEFYIMNKYVDWKLLKVQKEIFVLPLQVKNR